MNDTLLVLEAGERKPALKLFVRWDKSHYDAGGKVELQKNGEIIMSRPCGNNDRVYGYCMALVDILRSLGHDINMPKCLQRHISPNREKED